MSKQIEEKALHPSAPDLALVGTSAISEPAHKKRKGPKGPNPLSIKKKKTEGFSGSSGKGKGKEKEKTPSQLSKSHGDGREKVQVGQKRSREVLGNEEDAIGTRTEDDVEGTTTPQRGRKRKRRRKAASTTDGSPTEET